MITPRRVASVSVVLLAVACAVPTTTDGPTSSSGAAITGGTADTANPHTAVVALLSPANGGYGECSGTIVQVKSGVASVLTAAHCCNGVEGAAPSIVVMSNDYGGSVSQINSSSPAAPAYAVIASSVQWDMNYDPNSNAPIDDFCMLQFNAPANTPSIPVATGDDGLAVGSKVDYVGFGVTSDTNQNNTARNIASNVPIDTAVDANTFSYTESSTVGNGGPCSGDSGGPALVPPGVAQSQQKVVGTTSYGGQTCSARGSTGVDMRVTSETGSGGFISTYLGGVVTGNDAGPPPPNDAGSGGVPTTCAEANGTEGCCDGNTNYYCSSAGVLTTKACATGKVCGWSTTKGYYACVAPPGAADPTGANPMTCGGGTMTTDAGTDSGSGDAAPPIDGATGDSAAGDTGVGGDTGVTGDSGTGAGTGTGVGTADSGGILPPSDAGLRGADTGTAGSGTGAAGTGGDSGSGSFGSGGTSGGCNTSGSTSTPPWFAIGLGFLGVTGRRRRRIH